MEVVEEQQQHYDEVMRESAKHSALQSIKQDGEKGIQSVMYEQCDNYKNYGQFNRAMRMVAHKAYSEWLEDTQDEEVGETEDVYREHHPDYPRC